jgi:hypothetical protein
MANKNYVDNKALYKDMLENWYPAILKWKEGGSIGDPPPATEYMGTAIYMISTNFTRYYKFRHLRHIHEDMIGYACLTVIKYIHNFDPIKYKNPFAYITFIVNNAFLNFIKKETKNNKAKTRAQEENYFDHIMAENNGEGYSNLVLDKIESDAFEDKKFDDNLREHIEKNNIDTFGDSE